MKDKKTLIRKSIRVDSRTLSQLRRLFGVDDDSKAIRAAMNFTNNVAHNLFSGNLSNMFKRKRDNEEVKLYDELI